MTKTAKLMPEQEDASAIAKLFKSQEELMDSSLLEAELFEGAPEDESPTAALALSPKTARKMIQLRPIESECLSASFISNIVSAILMFSRNSSDAQFGTRNARAN